MPISEYLSELRSRLGHHLLLMPGVSALVFNDVGEILLHRHAETGRWAPLAGIMEPGEEPAAAVVREVLEETGVTVEPQRITGVYTTPVITYRNGDQSQYVVIAFACKAVAGTARVNDDESLEVRYFPLDNLPELHPAHRQRIEHARANGPAWFMAHDQI